MTHITKVHTYQVRELFGKENNVPKGEETGAKLRELHGPNENL
jgi:hypothetical protein